MNEAVVAALTAYRGEHSFTNIEVMPTGEILVNIDGEHAQIVVEAF